MVLFLNARSSLLQSEFVQRHSHWKCNNRDHSVCNSRVNPIISIYVVNFIKFIPNLIVTLTASVNVTDVLARSRGALRLSARSYESVLTLPLYCCDRANKKRARCECTVADHMKPNYTPHNIKEPVITYLESLWLWRLVQSWIFHWHSANR